MTDGAPMVISDDILESAHVGESEVRSEIALAFFARERLTLAQAARPADLPQLDFQALLAERKIPIHYDVAEFEEDLRTLERLAAR
jgi:predicted HTH domain antitoxin